MYEELRKQVSLENFLESLFGAPVQTSTGPRWSSCPHCGESEGDSRKLSLSASGEFFRCWACGSHGDVVEAAALYYRCTHKEAAQKLVDRPVLDSFPKRRTPRKPVPESCFVEEAISRLVHAQEGYWDYEAVKYLTGHGPGQRAIPVELLQQAHDKGYLRMLSSDPGIASKQVFRAIGKDLMVESGLWDPSKKAPAMIFRPIVFVLPGSAAAEFRALHGKAYGPKALRHGSMVTPWRWNEGGETVALVEGLIDLWSLAAMGFQGEILGLPGCRQWNPLWNPLLVDRTVLIKFDLDEEGQVAAADLWGRLHDEQIRAFIDCPTSGDINDDLVASLAGVAA